MGGKQNIKTQVLKEWNQLNYNLKIYIFVKNLIYNPHIIFKSIY